jgi:hypothetical protein
VVFHPAEGKGKDGISYRAELTKVATLQAINNKDRLLRLRALKARRAFKICLVRKLRDRTGPAPNVFQRVGSE